MEAEDKIDLRTNTAATEIVMEDGKAVGVKVKSENGEYTIRAKAVILASGGFRRRLDRVAALKPALAGFVTTNVSTVTGDGIDMAVAVGAATVDMDQIQIHPSVYTETTTALITEGIRGDGAILVNQEGKRFVNELETRDNVSAAELAQEGGYAYTILDQKMMDASSTYNGYFTRGYAVQADSYEALAEKLGIDPATFAATMETWNKAVADQKDDAFGRLSFASALDTPPVLRHQGFSGHPSHHGRREDQHQRRSAHPLRIRSFRVCTRRRGYRRRARCEPSGRQRRGRYRGLLAVSPRRTLRAYIASKSSPKRAAFRKGGRSFFVFFRQRL